MHYFVGFQFDFISFDGQLVSVTCFYVIKMWIIIWILVTKDGLHGINPKYAKWYTRRTGNEATENTQWEFRHQCYSGEPEKDIPTEQQIIRETDISHNEKIWEQWDIEKQVNAKLDWLEEKRVDLDQSVKQVKEYTSKTENDINKVNKSLPRSKKGN